MTIPDAIYPLTEYTLGLLWAIFAGSLTWIFVTHARNITYVTLADGRRQERRLPLLLRALLPLAPTFTDSFQAARFRTQRERIYTRLTAAGFDDILKPEEFIALRVLSPLVLGPLICLMFLGTYMLSQHAGSSAHTSRIVLICLAVIGWMAVYPTLWLKQAVTMRHRQIMKALPYVIDLLTLSVEAGLDFMTAIRNIVTRRDPDPLGEELSRVLLQIQLGKTRRDALRQMADRIQQIDILSMVTALVQADEMGVSIGQILRIQSDQIRTKRFLRAEKLANEAPVKMLFPLLLFIFPAVFLILLGPLILQILSQYF